MTNYTDPEELLPVVDENDRMVEVRTRREIHQRHLLHRSAYVLVFDQKGRIYLQRRSAKKDTHPLQWTASASGHVDPGESYAQAAGRELWEELGLELELSEVAKLTASAKTDDEFVAIYEAATSAEPKPNPQEILEGRFFSMDEALALAADRAKSCPSLLPVLEAWARKQVAKTG